MHSHLRGLIVLLALLAAGEAYAVNVYQKPDAFIKESFPHRTPAVKVIWPDAQLKQTMKKILGHNYQSLRIRYWQSGKRTAWILDEVGKDKPITTGVVINNHMIEKIRVLVFRESRGWEVQHRFFTKQFDHAALDNNQQLEQHIDNISGATLSVNALIKIARLALLLDQRVSQSDPP